MDSRRREREGGNSDRLSLAKEGTAARPNAASVPLAAATLCLPDSGSGRRGVRGDSPEYNAFAFYLLRGRVHLPR